MILGQQVDDPIHDAGEVSAASHMCLSSSTVRFTSTAVLYSIVPFVLDMLGDSPGSYGD